MKLLNPARLTLQGELDERIRRSVQHLEEINVPEMRREFTDPDDFWHWGADYMGRWIGSMSLLSQYTGEDHGALQVAREMVAFQKPDGSFGPYTDPHDFQEWFGMGRGLVGLLETYQVHPEPDLYQSILKLGNYYHFHYPECAPVLFECYSSALEGLVELARISGDSLFLETARRMAEFSVVYQGIRYSVDLAPNGRRTPCAGQVHCQLSTARGLLDLYELTGEARYLEPVLALHEYILNELVWVSGGIGFYYFRPEENETCADADWLRLNLQLWRLTRQAHFMELAERILVNQLFFNQVDNGGFCYLRGLENRAGAVFDACCSHHGPRALYDVLQYIFTTQPGSTWINLFFPGEARFEEADGILSLVQQVEEAPGKFISHISITGAAPGEHTLHVRIPGWVSQANLTVNGEEIGAVEGVAYHPVRRTWAPGDRLSIEFDIHPQVSVGQTLGRHVICSSEAAIRYGPRLFCLDDSHNAHLRIHLARLSLDQGPSAGIKIVSPLRLEARGSTPDHSDLSLILSPLAEVGGVPSGAGRIHTVRSPYYKVWIPAA